jgi:hypothetical protein
LTDCNIAVDAPEETTKGPASSAATPSATKEIFVAREACLPRGNF